MLLDYTRPVVGTGACLHADQARRQLRNNRCQWIARDSQLEQYALASFIYSLNGKHVLGFFVSSNLSTLSYDMSNNGYVLGHSATEIEHLKFQATLVRLFTQRMLVAAGPID
jgi:hypothetical protein